jgi:hypothetical protein
VRAAGDEIHGVAETFERATIGHLDREENGHAERDPEDIDRGQERVGGPVAEHLPPKQ